MKRRPSSKEREGAGKAAGEKPAPPAAKLSTGKKTLFAVMATGGFFLLLEIVLALCGVKPVLYAEDPYVGFASNIPLFVEQAGPDGRVYMATAPNKIRWFNPQRFLKKKPLGTYRIFSVGGSTTYGHPYEDPASFSGWLRELLPVADPDRKWEVINAGGISYASYRVTNLMRELVQYEPDLFIVYSGHNEFLERRTYQGIIEAPRALTLAGGLISRTRIYAAGKKILNAASRKPAESARPILNSEVDTMLDHTVGPRDYSRDDVQRDQVVAHFRFNLNRMIDIARAAGAEVMLLAPAVNLKDTAPFKSEHRKGLGAAGLQRFQALYRRASEARRSRKLKDALAALEEAARIDDRYADLHYQRGLVLYDLGRYEEAKAALVRALDEDICPLRALTSIRQIVTEVAAQRHASLIDFAQMIEERADHGIPGSDYFLDHVHLATASYRLLAFRIIDTLAQRRVVRISKSWNDAAVEAVTRKVESGIDRQAQGRSLRNLAKVLAWAGKLEEAEGLAAKASGLLGGDAESYNVMGRSAAARGDLDGAIRYFRHSLELKPGYVEPHNPLAIALMARGKLDEAITHFGLALEGNPNYAEGHYNLGTALEAQGRFEEAISHYQQALRINPNYAEAHNNLGVALGSQGKLNEAISHYQQALRIKPDYPEVHTNLGIALESQGNREEGIRHYREALRINPSYAPAWSNLGTALMALGKVEEAIGNYREALRIQADSAELHYNLGIALMSQRKLAQAMSQYQEALRIQPEYAEAHTNLGAALESEGKRAEAITHYRRALQSKPAYAEPRYNLGVALLALGRRDEAIGEFHEILRLQPNSAKAHYYLGNALATMNRVGEALDHFRAAVQANPDWPLPLNHMAWILATDPNPEIRDGTTALRLAARVAELTKYEDPSVLDTLAASYAEAGQFDQAITTAHKALELYSAAKAWPLVSQISKRLDLYQRRKPYRERAARL